ncbi:MAG: hypothetical protein M1497_03760 [Nitrospirae bacterium]|nr:hypothetical protein [Nitrospirota bacterium]
MPTQTDTENWLSLVRKKHREVFSEIDVLLRALDRFFNIENLPLSKENVANRNFSDELSAVRDTILRTIGLLDLVMPENRKNVYWFQKFAQAKFLNDKRRDAIREELYKQDVPEKSLFLLYDSFINLKGIVSDILRTEHIPYLTYQNIGQLAGREIRENVFFNPFRKDPNPEFDVIENREISKVVRTIKDREMRNYTSVILVYLFRFLRYLRYADTSNRFGSLHSSLLIILLLRSEFAAFLDYLTRTGRKVQDEGFRMTLRVVSYQFSMESRRVFLQELKEIFRNKSPQYLKGKLENGHGILKNLTEQSIVQIVQFFSPEVGGGDVFDTFITKREQSMRLREDVFILNRFLGLIEKETTQEERMHVFDAMRNFMLYFQSFTFKLLRYDDYEEFVSFFDKVLAFNRDDTSGRGFDKILDKTRQFRIFTETCLRQISARSELAEVPTDMGRIEDSLRQYLQ